MYYTQDDVLKLVGRLCIVAAPNRSFDFEQDPDQVLQEFLAEYKSQIQQGEQASMLVSLGVFAAKVKQNPDLLNNAEIQARLTIVEEDIKRAENKYINAFFDDNAFVTNAGVTYLERYPSHSQNTTQCNNSMFSFKLS
jgi:hypothetical protein